MAVATSHSRKMTVIARCGQRAATPKFAIGKQTDRLELFNTMAVIGRERLSWGDVAVARCVFVPPDILT